MPILVVSPLIREVGITEFEFGVTFTLASILLVFASPFWGKRSDAQGRRPFLLVGLIGSAIGTLAIALSLEAGLRGWASGFSLLVMLGLSRFVYSSLASAIYPSSSGYVADVTTREKRAQGLALLGAANGLGAVIGPLLVASLAFVSVLFPMYVAITLTLLAAAIIYLKLPEPDRHESTGAQSTIRFNDQRLRPYMITWCLLFMVFMAVQFVTAFFVQDRIGIEDSRDVARTVGVLLTAMAVVILLTQGLVLQFIRVPAGILYKACLPLFALALVVFANSDGVFLMTVGYALVGLSFSCAAPGINGSASLSVEAHEQGAAAGFLAAANTLGAILGPLVGTGLYTLGAEPLFYGCAALLAVLAIYAFSVKTPDA